MIYIITKQLINKYMAAAGITRPSKSGASAAFPITSEDIEEVIARKIEAARKIQKAWMMHKAKQYIDNPERLAKLPKPADGKTPVRILNRLVLKESDHEDRGNCQARLIKMVQARMLCLINGFTHLVVPKAEKYKTFLIEERLPIPLNISSKEQIGMYIENKAAFDDAVSEFMKFYSSSNFAGLTSYPTSYYYILSSSRVARHDNLPLFLTKEGVGKIGLIDLEHFGLLDKSGPKDNIIKKCLVAIRFFPLHFDRIIEIAKEYDPTSIPDIKKYKDLLIEERDKVLNFFENVYVNHKKFCQAKQITCRNPLMPVQISEERKEALIQKMMKVVLENENYKNWINLNFLDENREVNPKALQELLPKFIDAAMEFIDMKLKSSIESVGGVKEITSDPKLLTARTLCFEENEIQQHLFGKLRDDLNRIFKYSDTKMDFSKNLLIALLNELKTDGEINSFEPSLHIHPGEYSSKNYFIFC